MTILITTSAGSLPRIGEGEPGQKLRRAFARLDKRKGTRAELIMAQEEATIDALSIQIEAGLELVTDGQIRWEDPVSHLLNALPGTTIGPLARFMDTNFYYRQPIIKENIDHNSPILLEEFLFAQNLSVVPVKPVITGPYTLARLSINQSPCVFTKLVERLSCVIAQEVADLSRAGAGVIQIDEPAILLNPQDIEIQQAAIAEISRQKGSSELALYTYFGDAASLYDKLQLFPVDILGMDFTYSPNLPDVISASGTGKTLALGLIDGRNTRLETESETLPLLDRLLSTYRMKKAYINPSCGLEFLPKMKAEAKLENMVRLRNRFIGDR